MHSEQEGAQSDAASGADHSPRVLTYNVPTRPPTSDVDVEVDVGRRTSLGETMSADNTAADWDPVHWDVTCDHSMNALNGRRLDVGPAWLGLDRNRNPVHCGRGFPRLDRHGRFLFELEKYGLPSFRSLSLSLTCLVAGRSFEVSTRPQWTALNLLACSLMAERQHRRRKENRQQMPSGPLYDAVRGAR